MICIVAWCLIVAGPALNAGADVAPGDLLIYYAFPSVINGVSTVAEAAAEFGQYDFAILGGGLQDGPGDPNPHPDHQNTVQIINHPATANTLFFGYIDLGVTTNNYPISEVQRRVDAWQAMGIDGIFLDDFGYDFGTTRVRQNAAVDYVHLKGLPVFANGWVVADVFGDQVNAHNPQGLPTSLGASDYYLWESHQIKLGEYVPEAEWQSKANALAMYRSTIGFNILSNTTPDPNGSFDAKKFAYAWYSAAMYEHVATGWGEHGYSAPTSLAPYRPRPTVSLGDTFTSDVEESASRYTRSTELGTIFVDVPRQTAGFDEFLDSDGDGVTDPFDVCDDTPPGTLVKPDGGPLGDLNCDCLVDFLDYKILELNFGGP